MHVTDFLKRYLNNFIKLILISVIRKGKTMKAPQTDPALSSILLLLESHRPSRLVFFSCANAISATTSSIDGAAQ